MTRVTWRAPDDLVERVREAAAREGRSMNDYLTRLARAATDPAHAGSDSSQLRERLGRAGLLAPAGVPRQRPDTDAVAQARQRASRGTSLADLISEGRG